MNKIGVITMLSLLITAGFLFDSGKTVYQVTQHLGPTQSVTKEQLKAIKISKKHYHTSMLTKIPKSMFIKSNVNVLAGDILREEHLTKEVMEQEHRLVSIKADLLVAQGHAIQVLDRVDVSVTTRKFSMTLVYNATLIALKDRQGVNISEGVPYMMTLSVHKDHVDAILLGQQKGTLSLQKLESSSETSTTLNQQAVEALHD